MKTSLSTIFNDNLMQKLKDVLHPNKGKQANLDLPNAQSLYAVNQNANTSDTFGFSARRDYTRPGPTAKPEQ